MAVRVRHGVRNKIKSMIQQKTEAIQLPLSTPVQVFVIKNTEGRYMCGVSRKTWSFQLGDARKFNRQSDCTNCLNKLTEKAEVLPIVFTHGYQPV